MITGSRCRRAKALENEHNHGQNCHGNDRQSRVEIEEQGDIDDQGEADNHAIHEPQGNSLFDHSKIVRKTSQDITGLPTHIKVNRQMLHMSEHLDTNIMKDCCTQFLSIDATYGGQTKTTCERDKDERERPVQGWILYRIHNGLQTEGKKCIERFIAQ